MHKYKSKEDFYNNLVSTYSALISEGNQLKLDAFHKCYPSFLMFWKEKKQRRKVLGISSSIDFNIFTSIAEYYWYENLHSDILKNILDPFTPVVGNPNFLKRFLELIGIDTKTFDYKNANVERESKKIDLLISDENSAIIIENKINYAVDQPDQLPRYYEEITNPEGDYNKKVIKIVYLTLTHQKQPSFDYSKEYEKYKDDIRGKLIHVCAIDEAKNEFAVSWTLSNNNSFMGDLIKLAKKDKLKKKDKKDSVCIVYLQQYEQLLIYLGEDEIMSDVNGKIAKLMFETEDSSEMAGDIVNIYNDRYAHVAKICFEELVADKKNKFEPWDKIGIYKKISNKEGVFFVIEKKRKTFSYGFYNDNNDWNKEKQSFFKSKIKTDSGVVCESGAVYKYILDSELNNDDKLNPLTVSKMKKYITNLIKELASKM